MMIRSAPPASAHLADKPVPAPAPMMAWPRSALARSRARSSSRRTSVPALDHLVQPVGHRGGECGVVDVRVDPLQGLAGRAELAVERVAAGGVGRRVEERLPV